MRKLTVTTAVSRYGTKEPTITVRQPHGADHRTTRAAVFELAAKVERASTGEAWVVVVDAYGDIEGRVCLELMHGTPDEVVRGLAVMTKIVGSR